MKGTIWFGASVSPLIALIFWIIYVVLSPDTTPKQERSIEIVLVMAIFLVVLWYIVSFIGGAMLLKLLNKVNCLRYWPLVVLSALFGSGIFALFPYFLTKPGEVPQINVISFFLSAGGVLGFITTTVFWYLSGIATRA